MLENPPPLIIKPKEEIINAEYICWEDISEIPEIEEK